MLWRKFLTFSAALAVETGSKSFAGAAFMRPSPPLYPPSTLLRAPPQSSSKPRRHRTYSSDSSSDSYSSSSSSSSSSDSQSSSFTSEDEIAAKRAEESELANPALRLANSETQLRLLEDALMMHLPQTEKWGEAFVIRKPLLTCVKDRVGIEAPRGFDTLISALESIYDQKLTFDAARKLCEEKLVESDGIKLQPTRDGQTAFRTLEGFYFKCMDTVAKAYEGNGSTRDFDWSQGAVPRMIRELLGQKDVDD